MKMRENAERPGVFVTPGGRIFFEAVAARGSGGYHTVHLIGKETVRRHTLVAETYYGPRPDGAWVRHLDGNPANDHYRNIRWGTPKENGEDTVRHGRSTRGPHNSQAKLTVKQAREIKRRLKDGESGRSLATEFGLKQPTISNIKTGSTWSWLK